MFKNKQRNKQTKQAYRWLLLMLSRILCIVLYYRCVCLCYPLVDSLLCHSFTSCNVLQIIRSRKYMLSSSSCLIIEGEIQPICNIRIKYILFFSFFIFVIHSKVLFFLGGVLFCFCFVLFCFVFFFRKVMLWHGVVSETFFRA